MGGAGAEKHGIRVQRGVQIVEESGGRLLGLVAVVVLSRRGGLPLGFHLRLLGGVFSRLRRRFGGFGSLRSRLHLLSSNPTESSRSRLAVSVIVSSISAHNMFD